MGISILELVLRRLREENFIADVAFPGQKYPVITEPVAAVHIEKVDRANLTVTVEVNIICPAESGGAYCEVEEVGIYRYVLCDVCKPQQNRKISALAR